MPVERANRKLPYWLQRNNEHEGHLFANPAHQRDVIERTRAWFDAHLR